MNSDVALTPLAQAPVPIPQADLRPTADAAALVRDPQPYVPMPLPASNGQMGAVTESKVSASREGQAADPTERVLKPYGVTMLPDQAKQQEQAEKDAADKAAAQTAEADKTETKAAEQPEPKVEKKDPPSEASRAEPPQEIAKERKAEAEPPKESRKEPKAEET